MKNAIEKKTIILSMLLCGFMGLSVDIFLPTLNSLASNFDLTPGKTQLSISIFIGIFAIMQLIHGTLSDYFGRKNPLTLSLLVFTVSSFLCSITPSFSLLIIFRAIQAFGTAGAVVTSYALIRDFFEGEKYSKAMSYVVISRSLLPVVFSIIGGVVNYYFDWRFVFLSSAIIGLLIFIYSAFALEDNLIAIKKINWRTILADYKTVLKNPIFLTYNFLGIAEFTMLLTYLTALPFIFQHNVNKGSMALGMYIGINSLFLVIGSSAASLLIGKLSQLKILIIGIFVMMIASLLIFIFNIHLDHNTFTTFFPLYLFSTGCGMTSPIGMSLLLRPFKQRSGQAIAITGFLRFIIASIVLNIVLHFNDLERAVSFIIFSLSICNLIAISYSRRLSVGLET